MASLLGKLNNYLKEKKFAQSTLRFFHNTPIGRTIGNTISKIPGSGYAFAGLEGLGHLGYTGKKKTYKKKAYSTKKSHRKRKTK